MTNQQHPTTPPPELVQQWIRERDGLEHLATQAAQYGADQELEACIEWITGRDWTWTSAQLRNARRPKPPSLKEQALTALHAVATSANDTREQHQDLDTIRQALEALPND